MSLSHSQILLASKLYRVLHRKETITKARMVRAIGKAPSAPIVSWLRQAGVPVRATKDGGLTIEVAAKKVAPVAPVADAPSAA